MINNASIYEDSFMKASYIVSFHPSLEREEDLILYNEACKLIRQLKGAGHKAYFAGGAVRDMVLLRPLQDIDIATDASIEELKALFPKAILVGAQFGVLRVIRRHHEFEIASFRTESDYQDGRHPAHVEKASSYEEDAKRRDFTINGLFFNPEEESILDCVEGLEDIRKKQLRTIGSPHERFQEDRLRVLRAIRFSHSLHFPIQRETLDAMKEFAPTVSQHVSPERIWVELSKMNDVMILPAAFKSMLSIGLFQALFPFAPPESECMTRLRLLETTKTSLPLALSLLFYDVDQLSLWAREQFHISHQDELLMEQFQTMHRGFTQEPLSEITIVNLLALSFSEEILPLLALFMPTPWLSTIEQKRTEFLPWIQQRRTKQYLISGKTLLDCGIPPGKKVGELMEKAFLLSLHKRLLDKEMLLREILSQI